MPRPLSTLLLYAESADNATLSYQRGWPRAFRKHPAFRITHVDLAEPLVSTLPRIALLALTRRFDLVVLLHSVYSNACHLGAPLLDMVRRIRAPRVYFIGNEYKLMPGKMEFAEALEIDLLVSQSHSEQVHEIYRRRLGCLVGGLPNTGLDAELFVPGPPLGERPIDVGYRGYPAPLYLGHDERTAIAEHFARRADDLGLVCDVSTDPKDRFTEREWAAFLARCKGQLGTEAGGDYFELDDATRSAYNAWAPNHPGHGPDEVRERFFAGRSGAVPLRIVSSRNIEAAGTRTVQLLFDGEYGGYFQPDVHYIPLRKDFSNVEEAVAKLRDPPLRAQIADRALELARTELSWEKLMDRFLGLIAPLI